MLKNLCHQNSSQAASTSKPSSFGWTTSYIHETKVLRKYEKDLKPKEVFANSQPSVHPSVQICSLSNRQATRLTPINHDCWITGWQCMSVLTIKRSWPISSFWLGKGCKAIVQIASMTQESGPLFFTFSSCSFLWLRERKRMGWWFWLIASFHLPH